MMFPVPWWLLIAGVPLLVAAIVWEIRTRRAGKSVDRREVRNS